MPLIRYTNDDAKEELRIRTNEDVIVEFRKYAASFSRYHDALRYLLEHSEPPKVIERKFL